MTRPSDEPALVTGVVVAVLVLLAGVLGIGLDGPSVEAVVAPIVVAIITRSQVTPAQKSKA